MRNSVVINNNEINDKEYIKIPNKKSIALIQFLFWNKAKKRMIIEL